MDRIATGDEAGEGSDGRQALVACLDCAVAFLLEMSKELQHA